MAKETLEKKLRKASSMKDVFNIFCDYRVKVKVGHCHEPNEFNVVKSLDDGVLLSRNEKKSTSPKEVQRSIVYALVPYHSNILMQAEIKKD